MLVSRITYTEVADPVDLKSAYEFEGSYLPHIEVNGLSGSGKSTLLVHLVLRYIERNYTVIWREMGKYDILSRFQNADDIIEYYKSEEFTGDKREELIQYWEKYKRKQGNPFVIISSVEEIQAHKVNIIVWDLIKECSSKEVVIQQYYTFFKLLREKREIGWEEMDIVVILDEANHIIPTGIKNPFGSKKVRSQVLEQTWWLAQWRGFHVRFVMSTHSTRQLHLDARLQCDLFFFKKSDRKDSKDLMLHELSHLDNEEYWELFNRLKGMEVNEVLFIDAQRRYYFFTVDWIPPKYSSDEVLHFIFEEHDPQPIIPPVDYSWNGAKKVATLIFREMEEQDLERMFYTEEKIRDYDNKVIVTIKLKRHQFWNLLFRYKEFSNLFAQYLFLDAIEKNLMCLYEDTYLPTIQAEKESREEEMFVEIDRIIKSDLTEESKVYAIVKKHPNISERDLVAHVYISQNKASKYKKRAKRMIAVEKRAEREKVLAHAHT